LRKTLLALISTISQAFKGGCLPKDFRGEELEEPKIVSFVTYLLLMADTVLQRGAQSTSFTAREKYTAWSNLPSRTSSNPEMENLSDTAFRPLKKYHGQKK
jgi:hypothetical protein